MDNTKSKFPPFGSPQWHEERQQVIDGIVRAQRALRKKHHRPEPSREELDRSNEALRIATFGTDESREQYPEANGDRWSPT